MAKGFMSDVIGLETSCGANTGEGDALAAMLTLILQERSASDNSRWISVIFEKFDSCFV